MNFAKFLYLFNRTPLDDCLFITTKSKDIGLYSFRTHNSSVSQHLSKGESDALINLSQNKQFLVRKSGTGNSIVIVDRELELDLK